MNMTWNSNVMTKRKHTKHRKTKKTSFPKQKVENTGLNKPLLKK